MDFEQELAEAAADYRRYERARERLHAVIRAANAAGMRQVDILRAIDHTYTREQVRKISRKAG